MADYAKMRSSGSGSNARILCSLGLQLYEGYEVPESQVQLIAIGLTRNYAKVDGFSLIPIEDDLDLERKSDGRSVFPVATVDEEKQYANTSVILDIDQIPLGTAMIIFGYCCTLEFHETEVEKVMFQMLAPAALGPIESVVVTENLKPETKCVFFGIVVKHDDYIDGSTRWSFRQIHLETSIHKPRGPGVQDLIKQSVDPIVKQEHSIAERKGIMIYEGVKAMPERKGVTSHRRSSFLGLLKGEKAFVQDKIAEMKKDEDFEASMDSLGLKGITDDKMIDKIKSFLWSNQVGHMQAINDYTTRLENLTRDLAASKIQRLIRERWHRHQMLWMLRVEYESVRQDLENLSAKNESQQITIQMLRNNQGRTNAFELQQKTQKIQKLESEMSKLKDEMDGSRIGRLNEEIRNLKSNLSYCELQMQNFEEQRSAFEEKLQREEKHVRELMEENLTLRDENMLLSDQAPIGNISDDDAKLVRDRCSKLDQELKQIQKDNEIKDEEIRAQKDELQKLRLKHIQAQSDLDEATAKCKKEQEIRRQLETRMKQNESPTIIESTNIAMSPDQQDLIQKEIAKLEKDRKLLETDRLYFQQQVELLKEQLRVEDPRVKYYQKECEELRQVFMDERKRIASLHDSFNSMLPGAHHQQQLAEALRVKYEALLAELEFTKCELETCQRENQQGQCSLHGNIDECKIDREALRKEIRALTSKNEELQIQNCDFRMQNDDMRQQLKVFGNEAVRIKEADRSSHIVMQDALCKVEEELSVSMARCHVMENEIIKKDREIHEAYTLLQTLGKCAKTNGIFSPLDQTLKDLFVEVTSKSYGSDEKACDERRHNWREVMNLLESQLRGAHNRGRRLDDSINHAKSLIRNNADRIKEFYVSAPDPAPIPPDPWGKG